MRTLSSTALAESFKTNSDQVWLALLTISHSTLATPIRVVNNNENITSRGNLYQWFPFMIELPGEDPDSPSRARLRIDAVDRQIIEVIRSISSPPSITIEIILAATPDVVEIAYSGMTLREVQYDVQSISGDLVYESIYTEPVTTTMTPSRFPGLF